MNPWLFQADAQYTLGSGFQLEQYMMDLMVSIHIHDKRVDRDFACVGNILICGCLIKIHSSIPQNVK